MYKNENNCVSKLKKGENDIVNLQKSGNIYINSNDNKQ